MAQDGGTRGATFYGEIGRCRESQGWTTAYSMPERDGKDYEEDSPKRARAGSLAIVDYVTTSGAHLYPPGGCRVVFLCCYVCLVFKER